MATHPTKRNPSGPRPGRPGIYDGKRHPHLAHRLALLGAENDEICAALQITLSTFERWKTKHKEFRQAVHEGGTLADANMAERLYVRGCGFEKESVKIFAPQTPEGAPIYAPYQEYYPPDVRAAQLWLGNRQRARARWSAGFPDQQLGTAENPMHHLVANVGQSSRPLTPAITAAIEALAAARLAATEPEVDYIEGDSAEDDST